MYIVRPSRAAIFVLPCGLLQFYVISLDNPLNSKCYVVAIVTGSYRPLPQ